MSDLFVQYVEVGEVAWAWDDQNHQLLAAAGQVAEAPLAGLSPGVVGAAMMFRYRWTEHLGDLAGRAEHRADGLRDCLRDYVRTDDSSMTTSMGIGLLLEERR